MNGISARLPRLSTLWLFLSLLPLLGNSRRCIGEDIPFYQGEDGDGFLRIERLPDPHIVPMPSHSVTVQTNTGARELIRVSNGDCETVFDRLLFESRNPDSARLVVETKDESYYSILLDHRFRPTMATAAKVADILGLEIVHGRRRKLAFVIRANDEKQTGIEQFLGQPKWPEAIKPRKLNSVGLPELTYGKLVPRVIERFPNGGVLFVRQKFYDDDSIAADSKLYFDGVSIAELGQYFEARLGFPVLSQTKDELLYSFTLSDRIWTKFSFDKPVPLRGLGLSVTSDEVEMEAIVVRDERGHRGKRGATTPPKGTLKP